MKMSASSPTWAAMAVTSIGVVGCLVTSSMPWFSRASSNGAATGKSLSGGLATTLVLLVLIGLLIATVFGTAGKKVQGLAGIVLGAWMVILATIVKAPAIDDFAVRKTVENNYERTVNPLLYAVSAFLIIAGSFLLFVFPGPSKTERSALAEHEQLDPDAWSLIDPSQDPD